MAQMKTVQTDADVRSFINSIEDEKRRQDCFALTELIKASTTEEPKMWGASIVGFGKYHYKYESGHEGSTCLVGFASRKQEIVIYGLQVATEFESLLATLGKHKTGKGCLYIKRLSDVNLEVLAKLVQQAAASTKRQYSKE
jgi:hypothetical protein